MGRVLDGCLAFRSAPNVHLRSPTFCKRLEVSAGVKYLNFSVRERLCRNRWRHLTRTTEMPPMVSGGLLKSCSIIFQVQAKKRIFVVGFLEFRQKNSAKNPQTRFLVAAGSKLVLLCISDYGCFNHAWPNWNFVAY